MFSIIFLSFFFSLRSLFFCVFLISFLYFVPTFLYSLFSFYFYLLPLLLSQLSQLFPLFLFYYYFLSNTLKIIVNSFWERNSPHTNHIDFSVFRAYSYRQKWGDFSQLTYFQNPFFLFITTFVSITFSCLQLCNYAKMEFFLSPGTESFWKKGQLKPFPLNFGPSRWRFVTEG